MKTLLKGLLFICVVSASGCGTFTETRYLVTVRKTENKGDQAINWLRVDIQGMSAFSSARYLSDFFDASAVNSFFGTYVQPSGAQFPSSQPAQQTELVGVGGQGGRGSEFILLLSTNADAFADAVGSFAQSESVAADVVRLANRDKYQSAARVSAEAAEHAAVARQIVQYGDKLLSDIDTGNPDAARQQIVAFANQLAVATGSHVVFNSVADVKNAFTKKGQ